MLGIRLKDQPSGRKHCMSVGFHMLASLAGDPCYLILHYPLHVHASSAQILYVFTLYDINVYVASQVCVEKQLGRKGHHTEQTYVSPSSMFSLSLQIAAAHGQHLQRRHISLSTAYHATTTTKNACMYLDQGVSSRSL